MKLTPVNRSAGASPACSYLIGARTFLTIHVLLPWLLLLAACFPATSQTATNTPTTQKQARILIITGIDYPGHLWRQTTPVLAEALQKDSRLKVFKVEDPDFLNSDAIFKYDVIVLHFQNWQQPGPGAKERENLSSFVQGGKGLLLLHFASGAWHDEWPEFADLAGRVWAGQGVRQHDGQWHKF